VSLLVVGLSHRSAPVELLERTALDAPAQGKLVADVLAADHVDEALVLATCNRLEVYAEVRKFHAGVQEVSERLVDRTGVPLDELREHLYVHYEDRAVQHLFAVAAGLDSMVVGEQQILGQLRTALQGAREEGAVARDVGGVAEHALHVGKRVHAETGIGAAGRSLVSVGLDLAAGVLGDLPGRSALIVGAGSMSALAGATLQRRGVTDVTVASRTPASAERLASSLGGRAVRMSALRDAIGGADLLVSCTGAVGTVVPVDAVAPRAAAGRPLFVLDLALPRDVDPRVHGLAGVTVVDLETLRGVLEGADVAADVEAARRIVTDEVAEWLTRQRSQAVAPTVAALRARAQQVVDAELARLGTRLPELDERAAREVATTVSRVVDKLLHAPTVRVKELAGSPGGDSYAEVLRELFALDPAAADVVARADVTVEDDT
jgi:glutamyl-tRNA reductase